MQAHHNEKNEIISLSPTQYCALLLNFFVTLRQSSSSVDGKNGEFLSWNLQTTSQRQKKCYIAHSNYLGCNQLTKVPSNF